MNTATDRHLDLGCGNHPRNPYGRKQLFGTDIREIKHPQAEIRIVNHTVEAIPFPDDHFDSVSAFDFLEHVPRVLASTDDSMRFPFVQLMNEIYRVLINGGRFYAITPCYPSSKAFADPTHINIITDTTHEYFTGTENTGQLYGFAGHFKLLRAEWVVFEDALMAGRPLPWHRQLRRLSKRLRGKLAHFLWEFEAIKIRPQNK